MVNEHKDPTATARAAAQYRSNVGLDFDMSDALDPAYLDDTPEPEPVNAHCPGCRCPREVPEVRETVKVVRGRKVVKTFVGPFQI